MSYHDFVLHLEPVFYAPLDYVDFDSLVEDVVAFDVSEPTDAELVFAGAVINEEDAVKITSPIEFTTATGPATSASLAICIPEDADQDVFLTNSVTISVASDSVSVGAQTSPTLTPGEWHHLVLVGSAWDVQPLGVEADGLLLQHVAIYDRSLAAQEVADLHDVARTFRIHRDADVDVSVAFSDEGANGLAADWHIVSA